MASETNETREKSLNFLEEIIEESIAKGETRVQTRFPPEPNGYLHIGHAKSICINFGLAKKYGGKCNLRFDDTNPVKEDVEYVDSIKRDIQWLGFQWELERYASDYFDQLYEWAVVLIKKGLAYVDDQTQDEIREVVRYAADRGIRIIPEIEVPGHASASILAYPWIGSTSRREGKAVTGDLYDVTDPKVEAFLHDILDEVIGLFPSKIVHIGGDEANYVHWKNSPEIMAFMKENGLPTCTDLQVWAINRMSKYLASKGCRMIGWNEITGETVREGIQASQSEQLAPGTIVQFWDGDVSLVNKAIAKGYDVVNSNRFFTYVDYAYEVTPFEKAYSFDPIPEGLAEKDKKKILGLGCQMWGEYTPTLERVYYQTYPRIAAFAESGWTAPEKKSYPDFRKRLKKIEAIWKEKGYIKTQIGKY